MKCENLVTSAIHYTLQIGSQVTSPKDSKLHSEKYTKVGSKIYFFIISNNVSKIIILKAKVYNFTKNKNKSVPKIFT